MGYAHHGETIMSNPLIKRGLTESEYREMTKRDVIRQACEKHFSSIPFRKAFENILSGDRTVAQEIGQAITYNEFSVVNALSNPNVHAVLEGIRETALALMPDTFYIPIEIDLPQEVEPSTKFRKNDVSRYYIKLSGADRKRFNDAYNMLVKEGISYQTLEKIDCDNGEFKFFVVSDVLKDAPGGYVDERGAWINCPYSKDSGGAA
jgi:hypothetical protein